MKTREIKLGTDSTGVSVTYIKSRKTLRFGCWYDGGYGGMDGVELPLNEFLEKLGIKVTP